MDRKNTESLRVKRTDTIEEAMDKNNKLIRKVKSLEKENKKLRTKNHTLNRAWDETESFLEDVTEGKSLKEIIENVNEGKLKRVRKECPKCGGRKVKKIQFSGFHVVVCEDCKYREKVNEKER